MDQLPSGEGEHGRDGDGDGDGDTDAILTRLVVLMIISELQAGCDRRARNFTSDIKDSEIYTELLCQVMMMRMMMRDIKDSKMILPRSAQSWSIADT